MGGLMNALEVARELNMQFFTPSSIGAFGPSTPKKYASRHIAAADDDVWCQ